jgi:hypothetical protein
MKKIFYYVFVVIGLLLFQINGIAQEKSYRPDLAFREDWKEIPAAWPVTQEHVNHPDLILGLHGPGLDSIKKSHHDKPSDDPYYIWSGLCTGNWAVTLMLNNHDVNLSENARIRWRSKQSGLRELHVVLKLSDGSWLVSKQSDPVSSDWRTWEFIIADLDWYSLNIKTVTDQKPVKNPDLSRVEKVGFSDLKAGGASVACSRLDWIEVYGYLAERKSVLSY